MITKNRIKKIEKVLEKENEIMTYNPYANLTDEELEQKIINSLEDEDRTNNTNNAEKYKNIVDMEGKTKFLKEILKSKNYDLEE